MISPHDLLMIEDRARHYYISYGPRIRLEGMFRDLTDQEKRHMAYMEAVVLVLSPHGAINLEAFNKAFKAPYTAFHEPIEDGVYKIDAEDSGVAKK